MAARRQDRNITWGFTAAYFIKHFISAIAMSPSLSILTVYPAVLQHHRTHPLVSAEYFGSKLFLLPLVLEHQHTRRVLETRKDFLLWELFSATSPKTRTAVEDGSWSPEKSLF